MPALTIDIEARFAQFQDSLDKVAKSSARSVKQIDTAFAGIGTALAGIGVSLSIGAVISQIKGVADSMAALDDAAEQTGASVESLSSLLNTLQPSGASLEQITDIAGKLTKSMVGAGEETGKAAEAFKAIGVSTRDAEGNLRSIDDVLYDVAIALNQYADGSNKVAIAQALLGKSGAQYLPLLKDLATTERQAASVTTEQAAAAEALQKAWGRLAVEGDRLKNQIIGPLILALSEVANRFGIAQRAGAGFFASLGASLRDNQNARGQLEEVERNIAKAKELQGSLDRLGVVGTVLAGPAKLLSGANLSGLEQSREKLRAQVAILDAAEKSLRDAERAGSGPLKQAPAISGGGSGAAAKAAKDQLREVEDYAQRIQSEVAQAIQQSDVIRAREYADKIAALDRLFFDGGLNVEVYQSALDKIAGTKPPKDITDELERQAQAIRDSLDPLEKFRKELELIQQLEAGGFLSSTDANLKRFLVGNEIDGAFGNVQDGIKKTDDLARDLGLTFTSAFEDAIVEGRAFSEVLKGLEKDILRIITRKLVTEPLSDAISGAIKGVGSSGGIIGSIGSMLGGIFGGARASGGPVSAGKVFAVGERGPELFIPSVPGTIMPNHATQMGGGMTVQMTVVTPDAASFRRSEGQIGLKLASVASAGRRFA